MYIVIFIFHVFYSMFSPIRRFVPFDVLSHSAFFPFNIFPFDVSYYSTFCPIQQFFHSTLCPICHFLHSTFCPIRRFVFWRFVVQRFYFRRFLLRPFVSEPGQQIRMRIVLSTEVSCWCLGWTPWTPGRIDWLIDWLKKIFISFFHSIQLRII